MRLATLVSLILAGSFICNAQPVVAPTNEPLGLPRGENLGAYNITNSFETGYRVVDVNGNQGKYRSDVNFDDGLRLLGSNLTVHSREGHGKYFDELLLSTQGLGNDPYQFSSLRVQKNKLYKYDLLWRQNDYYNPALPIANGQHFMNTTRGLQDHSVILLPQSSFKLFAGYSRVSQSGPALSTIQLFDSRGDEFPLFSNIRRLQNEFRVGAELSFFGVKMSLLRTWEFFKDDTEERSDVLTGNNPEDQTALTSFRRAQPWHGSTRNWRVNLLSDQHKLYSWSGRFTYAGGRRDFILEETAAGTDRIGTNRLRQTLVFGNARRPVTSASLTFNLFPTRTLTLTNHTAFHHTRMDGDGTYRELNNGLLGGSTLNFQFLGIRTVTNATDANLQVRRWFGVFTGYRFSARRIRSIEQETFDGIPEGVQSEQDNALHSGVFGVRLRPVKALTIVLDSEIGRVDRAFYPVSEKDYHALGGRVQWKAGTLLLSASARTNYNFNSVSLTSHSSRSRNYFADASWTPRRWLGFDAGYSKLHLDTLSGLAYFANGDLLPGQSLYISNIHTTHFSVRSALSSRVDLHVGYSRVEDTGDGTRRTPGADLPFQQYQVFPLTFESPLARLSFRLHSKLRLNAGYQFYRYADDWDYLRNLNQNYRAHTGFTSLSWAF